jgi:G3E family GTPase
LEAVREAFGMVVRSKGFCWLAHTASGACFWSHAGSAFELQLVGRWWAAVDRKQWPQWQAESIQEDFKGGHGDRRQEVVIIGVGLDSARRGAIESALDWALLTDSEFQDYTDNAHVPSVLAAMFPCTMPIRPVATAA